MKRSWVRLVFVACVLALMVAGLMTQARPGQALGRHQFPEDTFKCNWPACTAPCDETANFGYCTEGKWGQVVAHSYNCCCCNADAKNRYFHGG